MNHNYQVSPPKRDIKTASREDEVPPAYLVLGAFCATPKIHFESVFVGESKKRTLIVRNPGETACFLKFLKRPSAVFDLNYGSEEDLGGDLLIPSTDQLSITITWTPKEEGQCFEVFQVQPSTGGTRLSVHLLGKALPPKKAKRRPGTAASSKFQQPIPPKANDPSLQLSVTKPKTLPSTSKLTIPHSPNFTTRTRGVHFSDTNGSSGDSNSTVGATATTSTNPPERPSSPPPSDTKDTPDQLPKTPDAMEKLNSMSLPFTPEPTVNRNLKRERGGGDSADILEEQKDQVESAVNPHATFIAKNDPELLALASPARRETYVVAPSPMIRTNNHNNTFVPHLEDCPPSTRSNLQSQFVPAAHQNSPDSGEKNHHDTSASIELDSNILDNITKTLDNDLDLAAVYRSMDTILDNVQQKSTTAAAAFTGLTELNEESYMDLPIDFEEEDTHLAGKAGSGEFLCMDHLDLVPNFPQGDVKLETEVMTSIKQMLKEGKTKEEIIASHLDNDKYIPEIRALYQELGNKYKSCRECYEVVKSFHLSEAFTFHRIVIKKAIEDRELVIKEGIDIRNFSLKTKIISSLLCSFSRPWLWSALCLVFNNDKLNADDIDMMNFIDENLFWNNELLDLGDPADEIESPKEFLELLAPRFLQKYLEILYLLDATEIPTVFYSNLTTKQFLDNFAVDFLGAGSIENILKKIPMKLTHNVDPIQYLIEENLRGPNMLAWTNIVRLVQELVNDPEGPEVSCNSSSVETAKESLRVALQEADKMGIQCKIEEDQYDWFFHGSSKAALDEKFLWQLVLRIRIAQCQKLQGSEE